MCRVQRCRLVELALEDCAEHTCCLDLDPLIPSLIVITMRATRSSTSKDTAAKAKPYDRPANATKESKPKASKSKGDKAASTAAPAPTATVNIGAPSAKQSSRKGKKAWRKNVDITAEETALEVAREEERVTGGKIKEKKDGKLFTIDTTGDFEGECRVGAYGWMAVERWPWEDGCAGVEGMRTGVVDGWWRVAGGTRP